MVVPNPLWIARLTQPAYTFIEDGTTYEVEIEVAAASPDMPAPSMRPDGNNPVEVYIATSSRHGVCGRRLRGVWQKPSDPDCRVSWPDRTGSSAAGPCSASAALQDSEPEGAETLWFYLERSTIVAIGTITFEGPDGRRDTNSVRYPATIVEANTPASGAPAIAGTGRAGETLRATTDAVSDVDGLGEFTYRWVRVDGSVETEIGTGAATYLPVADDVGKRIRVEVAFADALGFAEGPLASDSVAIRAAAPPAVCPVLDLAGTGRSALAPIRVGVGAIQVFKVPVAYGYYAGDAVLSAAGTIGGGSFALGGTAYAVEGAWAGTGGSLVFNLDGAVSAAERAALVLHVCGESYAFADAEHDPSTDAYTWQPRRSRLVVGDEPDAAPEHDPEPAHRGAGDRGHAPDGRDARGGDRRHRRRRRAEQPRVRLSVDPGRGGGGDGDFRRGGADLHRDRGGSRQGGAGPGALHRRPELRRGGDERRAPDREHAGDRRAGDQGIGPGRRHDAGGDGRHRRARRAGQRRVQLPVGASRRRRGDRGRDGFGQLRRRGGRRGQADPGRGDVHRRPRRRRGTAREHSRDGPGCEPAPVVELRHARPRRAGADLELAGDAIEFFGRHRIRSRAKRSAIAGPGLRDRFGAGLHLPLRAEFRRRQQERGAEVRAGPRPGAVARRVARPARLRRLLRLRGRGVQRERSAPTAGPPPGPTGAGCPSCGSCA